MYNLLFIGSSFFPLEQADTEEQLTKGLAFRCVWGGAQPIQVRARSGDKKYFCPSWMMNESKPWACLLLRDKIHGGFVPWVAWPSPGDRTQPGMAPSSCVPAEVTRSGINACAGELAKTFTSCWREWFEWWIYPRGRWINLQAGWREKARCDCRQITENL